MVKTFKKSEGYSVEDFVHYGYDHIDTGLELLRKGIPGEFASAGYLLQLGLELVFKAWHLFEFEEFSNTHKFSDLIERLETEKQIFNSEERDILNQIDRYYELRYPRRVEGPEIGQDDIENIESLLNALWDKYIPQELISVYEKLDRTKKAGQVLMEKKINSD